MEFTHKHLIGPKEQIPAMNRVKKILKEGNFSGTVFPFSKGIITIFSTTYFYKPRPAKIIYSQFLVEMTKGILNYLILQTKNL